MSRLRREAHNALACITPMGFVPPRKGFRFLCADMDVLNGSGCHHAASWRHISCALRVESVDIMGRDLSSRTEMHGRRH